MESKSKKLLAALIIYIASAIILYFVLFPLQAKYGLIGLIITELVILAIAIWSAIFTKCDLKQTFQLKPYKWKLLPMALLVGIGFIYLSLSISALVNLVFPSISNFANDTSKMARSYGYFVGLVTFAVLPAICEEALFRGTLQSLLSPLPSWLRVLLCGMLFGVFHFSLPRFFITATLGVGLAIIRDKTDSMIPNMFIHFAINYISFNSSYFYTSSTVDYSSVQIIVSIIFASFVTLFSAVPFIVGGMHLFKYFGKNGKKIQSTQKNTLE